MDGSKILSMVVEYLHCLHLLICQWVPKSMPKSFDLTYKKGYYPHFFNAANNLDYEGSHSEPKYFVATCLVMTDRNFLPGMRG